MASSRSSCTLASGRRPTFWGKIVTAEKPYHLHVKNIFTFRLTQAALDPTSSCSATTTPTSLLCKVGDKPHVIICTLRFESKEDCLLTIEYGGPSNVVFSLQSPGPIHISSYFFCDPPLPPSFIILPTRHPENINTEGEHQLNILHEERRSQRRRNYRMNDVVGDAMLNDTLSDIDGHLSVPNNTHINFDNTAEDVHLKDKNEGSKEIKHSKKDKARKRKPDATGDENSRNYDDVSKGIDSLRDEPKDTGASVDSEFVFEKELKPKRKRKRSGKLSSHAHNSTIDIIPLDSCNADEINDHAIKDSELIHNVEPGSALERSMGPSDLQELGQSKKNKKKTKKVEGHVVETDDASFRSMSPSNLHESGCI